jgi:hypothetical protein
VSINSDDAELARRLNMEAAKAVRYGDVTDDEAFAMVTINPARQLKIENRVGSIEVGKDADLVVWNHHPLSSLAIVERTYIDGIAYYDREKDLDRVASIERRRPVAPLRTASCPHSSGSRTAPVRSTPPAERLDVKSNATGPTWAITNARIITVSGPAIEGTVVIRATGLPRWARTWPSVRRQGRRYGRRQRRSGMIDAGTDMNNEPGVPTRRRRRNPAVRSSCCLAAFKADSVAIPSRAPRVSRPSAFCACP